MIHIVQVFGAIDWDAVRAKQDINYEYYVTQRDKLMTNDFYKNTWVIIANETIGENGPTYLDVKDNRDIENGDIAVCVGDDDRSVASEETLCMLLEEPDEVEYNELMQIY